MVRTQIQLTETQMEMVRRLAGERHLSMAEVIRQGVEMLLRAPLPPDRKVQTQRALEAAGRFRSGHRDTSAEHDEVLSEAYRQ